MIRQLFEQTTVAAWGRISYSDFQLEQVSIIPYQVEVNTVQLKTSLIERHRAAGCLAFWRLIPMNVRFILIV